MGRADDEVDSLLVSDVHDLYNTYIYLYTFRFKVGCQGQQMKAREGGADGLKKTISYCINTYIYICLPDVGPTG